MNVIAKPWKHGWELRVEDVGVTQVHTLAGAAQQAADLVETMTGEAVDPGEVRIRFELPDGLAERAEASRRLVREAEEINIRAAAESRAVARALRATGLSVTDVAAVLGVSRGRVSQLAGG